MIFLKNLRNQKNQSENKIKALTLKNAIILLNERQKGLNAFEKGIFPKRKQGKGLTRILDCVAQVAKVSDRNQLKILTLKQMFQRLPIVLAQVKAGTTSENLRKKHYIFFVASKTNC